jgi:hypothetical protein
VPGERQQIDAEIVHVDRHLAERLGRVGVDKDAARPGQCGDFADRLQGADLVVRVHDADERRPVECRRHRVHVDAAEAIDADPANSRSQALEIGARLQRRGMFDRRGDDRRRPTRVKEREDGPLDRVIARLAAAAGEDDLARLGA